MEETEANAIHLGAFVDQPIAAPHQSFLPIGSEVPLVKKSSSPPGEAKNSKDVGKYHSIGYSVAYTSGGLIASPTSVCDFATAPKIQSAVGAARSLPPATGIEQNVE